MFQSNFDDFFRSEHHRHRLGAGKVEKWVQMTPFCTRNISTMFGVHFLSFPLSTTENYFGRILTNIPGTNTNGAGPELANLKIGHGQIGFVSETYPHCLWCSSYRFSSVRLKKILLNFKRLFRAQKTLEQEKLKTWHKWLSFVPETYPQYFGCSFYHLPSVRLRKFSVDFWRLCRVWTALE